MPRRVASVPNSSRTYDTKSLQIMVGYAALRRLACWMSSNGSGGGISLVVCSVMLGGTTAVAAGSALELEFEGRTAGLALATIGWAGNCGVCDCPKPGAVPAPL